MKLEEVLREVKKYGFTQIDVSSKVQGDRMLEVNQNPTSLDFHYFLNDQSLIGRKAISEREAKELIENAF